MDATLRFRPCRWKSVTQPIAAVDVPSTRRGDLAYSRLPESRVVQEPERARKKRHRRRDRCGRLHRGPTLPRNELACSRITSIRCSATCGFDAEKLLAANTARSVERGTFGAPTFFIDDEIYFGKDRLRDVEEAIVAGRS